MKLLTYEKKDGVLVFKPEHYIELEFKKTIERMIENNEFIENQVLLFNLENVQLINSHGASAFLYLFKYLQKTGGILAFCNINDLMIKETFKDTGITWLCEKYFFETEKDALVQLNKT